MLEMYEPARPPERDEMLVRGLRHHLTRWQGSDPEPLVLLHGWMDSGDTFQFLVDRMSPRWSFIAPDLRGFGRTEWPVDGYWFPDYFADLEMMLDQLAPGAAVTLIGHSMGGNISTLYAGIRPERVRRVVCIEGFGLPRTEPGAAPGRYREWLQQLHEPPEMATLPSLEVFAKILERRNPRLSPERAAFIASSWSVQLPDGSVRVRGDPAHKRVNPVLYRREEAEACWREIRAPLLYVVAEQSEFLKRLGQDGEPASMAALIPELRHCVIPEASHMVHHDQPELLATVIEDFLAST